MTPASRALLAEADRRARLIAWARTEEVRRALARRICFDLVAALRAGRDLTAGRDPRPSTNRSIS